SATRDSERPRQVEDEAERDEHDPEQEHGLLTRADRPPACDRAADHRVAAGREHSDEEEEGAADVVDGGDRPRDAVARGPGDDRSQESQRDGSGDGSDRYAPEHLAHPDPAPD